MSEEERKELTRIEERLNELSKKYECCFEINVNEISYIDRSNKRWVHRIRAYIPKKELQ